MSKIFVVSDTWFNRLMDDEQDINVVDNNNNIINGWNSIVDNDDIVYVLGGFGIADLYHIVAGLHGEIHFLDNFYGDGELQFIDELKDRIEMSNDENFKDRIIFENEQILVMPDIDCILSYLPLSDWNGKDTGVYCFHGFNDDVDMKNHNISCSSYKWNHKPVNIEDIIYNIQETQDIVG